MWRCFLFTLLFFVARSSEEESLTESQSYTAVYIFGSIIVAISILFDLFKEKVEETISREFKPMLDALFQELTLLGFVGLVFFVINKVDIWHDFVEESHVMEVSELFETVHMVIFLNMVVFLCAVVLLAISGSVRSKSWHQYEMMATDGQTMHRVFSDLDENEVGLCSRLTAVICQQTQHRMKVIRYALLRDRFIHGQNGRTSVTPPDEILHRDFDFALYLSRQLGVLMESFVEIHPAQHGLLWLVFTSIYVLLLLWPYENASSVLMVIVAWTLPVFIRVIQSHTSAILHDLTPRYVLSGQRASVSRGGPNIGLLNAKSNSGFDGANLQTKLLLSSFQSHIPDLEVEDPPYVEMNLESNRCCCAAPATNGHEALFYLEKRGPAFLLRCVQLICMTQCNLISIAGVQLASSTQIETTIKVLVGVLMILPVLSLAWMLPQTLNKICLISSIEAMKSKHSIRDVTLQCKAKKTMKILEMLAVMQMSDEITVDKAQQDKMPKTAEEHWKDPCELDKRKKILKQSFAVVDIDGDGIVDCEEFTKLLESLGLKPTIAEKVFSHLDSDKSGTVDFTEFLNWIAVQEWKRKNMVTHSESLVEGLFQLMDADGDGVVTIDEFRATMSRLGEPMSAEEVRMLISEVDEDGDGQVNKEEMNALIKKYSL